MKKKIDAYMKKYNPNVKKPENKEVYWAGIHKSICNLFLVPENNITIEQFMRSSEWLDKHGFGASIE